MSELMMVLQREVPPEIVQLAHKEFSGWESVRQVIFGTDPKGLLEGHLAAFVPETGSVIIDLDACVKDLRWMDKGATFIANAWFNLLYAIFHEAGHAWEMDNDCPWNEPACDDEALNAMYDWCEDHPLPLLEDMGYLGDRIKVVLNAIWTKHEAVVENEIRVCGRVAAYAKRVIMADTPTEKALTALTTAVEAGEVGEIIDGEMYLTTDEFLAAIEKPATYQKGE
jgi:hypothetical protein